MIIHIIPTDGPTVRCLDSMHNVTHGCLASWVRCMRNPDDMDGPMVVLHLRKSEELDKIGLDDMKQSIMDVPWPALCFDRIEVTRAYIDGIYNLHNRRCSFESEQK